VKEHALSSRLDGDDGGAGLIALVREDASDIESRFG
jgi:hypothetical protein